MAIILVNLYVLMAVLYYILLPYIWENVPFIAGHFGFCGNQHYFAIGNNCDVCILCWSVLMVICELTVADIKEMEKSHSDYDYHAKMLTVPFMCDTGCPGKVIKGNPNIT